MAIDEKFGFQLRNVTQRSYDDLLNKPILNGVTIEGDKESVDYGLASFQNLEDEINRATERELQLEQQITNITLVGSDVVTIEDKVVDLKIASSDQLLVKNTSGLIADLAVEVDGNEIDILGKIDPNTGERILIKKINVLQSQIVDDVRVENGILYITFIVDGDPGTETIEIDLSDFIDVYFGSTYISINDNNIISLNYPVLHDRLIDDGFLLNTNLVQELGNSTTDIMSQNAVTSALYSDPDTRQNIFIGTQINGYPAASAVAIAIGRSVEVTSGSTNGIAIGQSARINGASGISIGRSANVSAAGSIAIGPNSISSGGNSISLGSSTYSGGSGSIVIGNQSTSAQPNTVLIGIQTTSTGESGISIGNEAGVSAGYGIAIGYQTVSGQNGVAIGTQASAIQNRSIAIGAGASSPYQQSVAIGYNATTATSNVSVALGPTCSATSNRSVAIGWGSTSSASDALAIGGSSARAIGLQSLALGNQTLSNDNNCIAIGYSSSASQNGALALGGSTSVNAIGGTAIGLNSSIVIRSILTKDGGGPVAIGHQSTIVESDVLESDTAFPISVGSTSSVATRRRIINLAPGVNSSDAVTVGQIGELIEFTDELGSNPDIGMSQLGATQALYADPDTLGRIRIGNSITNAGGNTIAIGFNTDTNGAGAVGIGFAARTTQYATALGYGTIASGTGNVSIGQNASTTISGSIAIGQSARSITIDSVAIGRAATLGTGGTSSIAIGADTNVTGSSSVAIGIGANTNSNNTIVIGNAASISGTTNNSVVIGPNASHTASGSGVIIGRNATASAGLAIVLGQDSSVSTSAGIAIGPASIVGQNSARSIAIGQVAKVYGQDGIVVGYNSEIQSGVVNAAIVGIGSTINAGSPGAVILGSSSTVEASGGVAVGSNSKSLSSGGTSIGSNTSITLTAPSYSVAIGYSSSVLATDMEAGEPYGPVSVGTTTSSTVRRRIINVKDGINPNDAVTKQQLDAIDIEVVQTLGTDETIAMSQDAITKLIYPAYETTPTAIIIGNQTNIQGESRRSTIIGTNNSTMDNDPADITMIGYNNRAGNSCVCVGTNNLVGVAGGTGNTGSNCLIGYQVYATGSANVGVGYLAKVGEYSVALGYSANTSIYTKTVSLGASTRVFVNNCVAIGADSTVERADTTEEVPVVSFGMTGLVPSLQQTRRLINVSDGINDTDVATVGQLGQTSTKGSVANSGESVPLTLFDTGLILTLAYKSPGVAAASLKSSSGTVTITGNVNRQSFFDGTPQYQVFRDSNSNNTFDTTGREIDDSIYMNSNDFSILNISVNGSWYQVEYWISDEGANAYIFAKKKF